MRMPSAAITVTVAALGAVSAVRAQNPQQPPLFRGGTDLVEVDVVVHGKNGMFVGDLSSDDFVVEEQGRVQPIEQLYLHLTNGISRQAPSVQSYTGDTAARDRNEPRVFVVVFDDEHLTPAGFKRTQAAAQSLFTQSFRTGDIGGVVTRGRMTNDRLTSNREELLRTVKDAKPSTDKTSRIFDERQWPRLSETEAIRITVNADRLVLEDAVRRACDDDPDQCKRADPNAAVRAKAAQMAQNTRAASAITLRTLSTLLTGLAKIPGRKTLLLMSEGFLAEDEWPLVHETVTLAARANARIYTLDARGLNRGMRSVDDVAPSGDDRTARLLEQMDFGADSVNSLAVDSGGFVVRNTNQFDAAIARIADDAGNYYVLGIRPGAPADGRFHPITVKVKRPNVATRARRGYVAGESLRAIEPSARPANTDSGTPDAALRSVAPRADPAPAAEPARGVEPAPVSVVQPAEAAEPAAVDGSVVHHEAAGAGLRLRPDADTHANTLAASNRARDPEATAGWEAYQRGDVETARAHLSAAAARSGHDAWVYYTLGLSNYALRQYKEASSDWERVRSAVPDFEPVYFDLIDAYLQQKEHDTAARIARAGIERWPKDPELLNALGVVQTSRGALDDAVKSFQTAITVAPQEATAYFNLAKALEMRYTRSRRYVQQLRSWVAHEPDRESAIQNYQRYLALGGAYADSAKAGLARLQWTPKQQEL